jgi:Tfp pilus assembly pilus retraction ATPase PilT
VRKLILEESPDKLMIAIETGKEEGMQSFNQALYNMVKEGLVDQEVALRFASNPEALRMNLRGIFLDSGSRIVGR